MWEAGARKVSLAHMAPKQQCEAGASGISAVLTPRDAPQQQAGEPTVHSAILTASNTLPSPKQQCEASGISASLPTARSTLHKAAWESNELFHHGWDVRRCYSTTATPPIVVRAIVTEIGTHQLILDPTDPYTRLDMFMAKNLNFELIQGHSMIADSFNAMMWRRGCRKALENIYWLTHYNRRHKICVAASLFPENVLVSEKTFSIKLIDPIGHMIDGVNHRESDALKKATTMFVDEVKKHQPHVSQPRDFARLVTKVEDLKPDMTTAEEEFILYDASLLDDSGYTAGTNQGQFLHNKWEC